MTDIEQQFQKAFARHQAGDLPGAETLYRQVLRKAPRHTKAIYLLGSLHAQRRDYAAAIPLLERAVALDSGQAPYLNNLGVALKETRRYDDALAAYKRALALKPNYPEAFNNLGILFKDQGKMEEAIAWFHRAVEARPDYADAHNNLGLTLRETEQPLEVGSATSQAEEHFRRAIAARPGFAAAHNNLGFALRTQGRLDEAAASIGQALALQPDSAEAHNNLGLVFHEQDREAEAEAQFRRALALQPSYGDATLNLAGSIQKQGRYREALRCLEELLAVEPGRLDARMNRAFLLLLLGEMEEGWAGYEIRLEDAKSPERVYKKPRWDGSPLAGRTLLVYAEQGYGDTFQFIRYLPLIGRDGGRVIFECQPRTKTLLEGCAGIDELIERPEPGEPQGTVPHDVQIALMSLAQRFPHPTEAPPGHDPYIFAAPDHAALWGERLAQISDAIPDHRTGNRKIGLIWGGNPNHANDRNRSARLADFAPLARVPGVTLYSLQRGPAEAQAANPPAGMTLVDLAGALDNFADTAAILENLDLVITVDTSVAHLAGAMGRPTWLLLPFAPEWRWMRDREDSPWYPSMRLFRQPRPKDWASVLAQVAGEMERQPNSFLLERIEAAEALFSAGDMDEAKASFRAIERDFPPHPRVLNNLGVLLWRQGAAAEALATLQRALEIAPHDRTTRRNCTEIMRALGFETEAARLAA